MDKDFDDRTPIQDQQELSYDVNVRGKIPQPQSFKITVGFIQALVLTILIILGVWMNSYFFTAGFHWEILESRSKFHPLFMTMGYLFLSTEAVLIFRMFRTMDRKLVKYGHVILHTITLIFSITALVAIITFKNDGKKPLANFFTTHSWIGLLVLTFYVVQYLLGVIYFLLPESVMPVSKRKRFLPIHRFFGAAAYLTSLVAVASGAFDHLVLFYANYSDIGIAPRMGNTMGILVVIVGILAGCLLVNRSYKSTPPQQPSYNPGVF